MKRLRYLLAALIFAMVLIPSAEATVPSSGVRSITVWLEAPSTCRVETTIMINDSYALNRDAYGGFTWGVWLSTNSWFDLSATKHWRDCPSRARIVAHVYRRVETTDNPIEIARGVTRMANGTAHLSGRIW